MKKLTKFIPVLLVVLFVGNVFAQGKIRFVDTEKIKQTMPEAIELQKKLEQLNQQYQMEYQQLEQNVIKKNQEYQNQNLMWTPELKAQKEQELQQMYQQLENYKNVKFGPQGEYYQKSQELAQPVIDKIQNAIDLVAKEKGYDLVLDINTMGLLYFNKANDITDEVLEKLKK